MVKNLTLFPLLKKEQVHMAELSKELSVPHPTLRLWLNEFENSGIIKKEQKGRLNLYSLNKKNPMTLHYLVIAEKQLLINKCKDLILNELVKDLQNLSGTVVIFGSAVYNIKKANDLDLIISSPQEKKIQELEKKFNKTINPIVTRKLQNLTDTLKKEVINNHLVIKNTEDFLNWVLYG